MKLKNLKFDIGVPLPKYKLLVKMFFDPNPKKGVQGVLIGIFLKNPTSVKNDWIVLKFGMLVP